MKLWSDTITPRNIREAVSSIPDVEVTELKRYDAIKSRHRYVLHLRGSGTRHTRWPNPGQGRRPDYEGGKAATRDDWGQLLAALYEIDPSLATDAGYLSRTEFHVRTNNRYLFEESH